ncbi:MAG TPA: DUF1080 domain-containing protein [Planctomycetota bacterium]|jgi:hypothetical protein|nr:DUF1080 domain-containing protein [Planctomycetota bacterium]
MPRFILLIILSFNSVTMSQELPGYTDTPLLPNSVYRVHDRNRPRPVPVPSGNTLGLPQPTGARVLFDGSDLKAFSGRDDAARWDLKDGAMVVNGTGNISTRDQFGDMHLHLEWRAPKVVRGESQGRGNSGVFLMGRYEIQVLDSFENPTYADGQAGALYGQFPPLVNACRPPGEWQSYDIFFRVPRFQEGALTAKARVTVLHNGVLIQNNQEFLGSTRHRTTPSYETHPERGPVVLQDHGDPVEFRNIWILELREL